MMKYCSRLLVLAALVSGVAFGNAWAVGYERQDANGVRGASKATRQVCPTVWDSLKKIPDAMDGVSSSIKDILRQFGLNVNGKR